MPSVLSDEEKQTVKRTVPKASIKIHAVAVAKLYVAYPNRSRWTYSGLQGAVVLANDLVGNTYWLKLVDISSSNRGVLWDQEIYDTFQYNQDRTFFHTFELEQCLAGLSFVDEREAKQFKKKMDEREKNAHKNTRNKPFGSSVNTDYDPNHTTGSKSRFGIGSLLPGHGQRHSSAPVVPQSIIPPRDAPSPAPTGRTRAATIDLTDPAVKNVLNDLLAMGITEDQIEQHADFIRSYLEQNKASEAGQSAASRPPPPPPPGAAMNKLGDLSPQTTGGSSGASRRGPAPAPPPSRRGGGPPAAQRPPSPSPSPPPQARFRVPPPIADAGKLVHHPAASDRITSGTHPGPPPPPRPQQDDETPASGHRFGIPPPFMGNRTASGQASRGPVPPPPPRDNSHSIGPPPPLPPKVTESAPPPPPLPPPSTRAIPSVPGSGPPAPPPLPSMNGTALSRPPALHTGPPPPPPMPPLSVGPPPPPLPPARGPPASDESSPPPLPTPGTGHGGLLADIRGGARLKKVSEQEKNDRSRAAVPGAEPVASTGGNAAPAGAAEGGLAGALASALAARKSKVSNSDDEDEKDDW